MREQNTALQQQLQKQNESLDTLAKKVQRLDTAASRIRSGETLRAVDASHGLKSIDAIEAGIVFQTGSDRFANFELSRDDARSSSAGLFWQACREIRSAFAIVVAARCFVRAIRGLPVRDWCCRRARLKFPQGETRQEFHALKYF